MSDTIVIRDQFAERARSIFFARLAIDFLGVIFLLIPSWAVAVIPYIHRGLTVFFIILFSHTISYLWIDKKWDKAVYFISLCLDLFVLTAVIVLTGGLASPIMSGHTLYAVFFVLLYPNPLAILPPLLILPIMTKLTQVVGSSSQTTDLLLLLWYTGVDLVILYIIVRFDVKETLFFKNAIKLEQEKRLLSLVNERQHIAREMHDGIGAMLSGLTIQTEFLTELLEHGDKKELKTEISELHTKIAVTLDELRRTMRIMREDFELDNLLDELIENMKFMWKYKVDFEISIGGCEISQEYQLNFYRIIQETLTNTGKHAKADKVSISFKCLTQPPEWLKSDENTSGLELIIQDNGIGSEVSESPPHHYGLNNLKERVAEMNGTFKLESSEIGTSIFIWTPLS